MAKFALRVTKHMRGLTSHRYFAHQTHTSFKHSASQCLKKKHFYVVITFCNLSFYLFVSSAQISSCTNRTIRKKNFYCIL